MILIQKTRQGWLILWIKKSHLTVLLLLQRSTYTEIGTPREMTTCQHHISYVGIYYNITVSMSPEGREPNK